jgi:hypothetical protein
MIQSAVGNPIDASKMRKSYRLRRMAPRIAAIFAVGALAAALSFANYRTEHSSRRVEAARIVPSPANAERIDRCARYDEAADRIACFAGELEAQQKQNRAGYELWAQHDMSEWAYAMFLATLFSVALTALGVGFIALTLGETRRTALYALKSLREARRTTKQAEAATGAAIKTTQETRRVGEIQTRAWLYITFKRIHPPRIVEDQTSVLVDVVIENHGFTPASISQIDAGLYYDPGHHDIPGSGRDGFAIIDLENHDHFEYRSRGIASITEIETLRQLWPGCGEPEMGWPHYSELGATEIVIPKGGRTEVIQVDFRFRQNPADPIEGRGRFSLHIELPYLDVHQVTRRTCAFLQVEGSNHSKIHRAAHNRME